MSTRLLLPGTRLLPIVLATLVGSVANGMTADWTPQRSGTDNVLAAVHFADVDVGYAVGFLTVLRTQDGGATWETMNTPASATFVSVYARSATDVFVGRQGLYHSTDGGRSWQEIGGLIGDTIFDIKFTSATTGFLIKSGIVYRTIDGGESWTAVFNSGLFLSSLETPDAQTIYAAGGITYDGSTRADFARSFDGGDSWEIVPQPGLTEFLTTAWAGPRDGFAFTLDQTLLATADGGDSWTPVNDALDEIVLDADFRNAQTGVAVCASGHILTTTDGGVNWSTTPASRDSLAALARPCGTTYYAVGNGGLILKRMEETEIKSPRITALDYASASGEVTLHVQSVPCRRYRIEASTDLTTWNVLMETRPESAEWQHTFSPTGPLRGFYRIAE